MDTLQHLEGFIWPLKWAKAWDPKWRQTPYSMRFCSPTYFHLSAKVDGAGRDWWLYGLSGGECFLSESMRMKDIDTPSRWLKQKRWQTRENWSITTWHRPMNQWTCNKHHFSVWMASLNTHTWTVATYKYLSPFTGGTWFVVMHNTACYKPYNNGINK
jgi:hypothetical protein